MRAVAAGYRDPLAAALAEARGRGECVADDLPWSELTIERARSIGSELYERACADPPSAWKMGAFDAATQRRLSIDGPVVAPVLAGGLHVVASPITLELAHFVQPKLEAEIGIQAGATGLRLVPCVEIADCRFPEWAVPPGAALADFALQGAMVFGPPRAPTPVVRVSVRLNGDKIDSGEANWDEARSRLDLLPFPSDVDVLVATGAITTMMPARPGRWDFDFHEAGSLTIILR